MAKKIFILINIFISIYLLLPFPTFPDLPESVRSTEPGDTIQLKNVKAFYTNKYRATIMPFYYKNITKPYILINHPPERAKQIFRDTTQSYYLEEFVVPLKGSIYVNGFEWENDVFTKKDKREVNKMIVDSKEYKTKISVRTFESNILLRFLNLAILNLSIFLLIISAKKVFHANK